MEFLNLHLPKTLRSAEFIGSDPVCRATWLCLMGYCAETENSGRIPNCKGWKDRKWQQICGITLREVSTESELWSWDGDDLVVAHYPIEAETNLQTKREIARSNGQSGGRKKKTDVGSDAETDVGSNIGSDAATKNEPTLPSLKERKGNGMEESESVREARLSDQARTIVEAYPRREKIADALTLALHALRNGENFEAMLAGTRACAAVIRTLPSAEKNRYVPSAEAFFRDKRWRDDPETLKRQGNTSSGQGQMSLEDAARSLGRRANPTPDTP